MDIIKDFKRKIDKYKSESISEIDATKELLKTTEKQKEKQEFIVSQALNKGLVKEYQEENAKLNNINDSLKVFKQRVEHLEKEPVITKEEYNKELDKVLLFIEDTHIEHLEKVIDLINQIETIVNEHESQLETWNGYIKEWQHDIYKDDCMDYFPNGKSLYCPTREKMFKDYGYKQWCNTITKSYLHKGMIEKVKNWKEYKEKNEK